MKVLLLLFVLIGLTSMAQEPAERGFPLKDGSIYYESIVDADSLSKDQIYKIFKSWGVGVFKSQKDVTQSDDREVGIIAFKSFFKISFMVPPILG
ncbi:MAG: DUF4468 domain-containing protein [Bacteroidota bacterium]|nr:DUF4468 domain-containing protein [Bacteroidota bacterium]